jgi:hypothetical protein
LGALCVVYTDVIACPLPSPTARGGVNASDGVLAFRAFSAADTEEALAAAPCASTMWTMLFLLRKVTSAPEPLWVQPSGYLIEYAGAPVSVNVRKFWLSGMSPVAAERASADRAPAAASGVLADPPGELVPALEPVLEVFALEPQPPAAASATAQDAPARSLNVKCMRVPSRYHLTIS